LNYMTKESNKKLSLIPGKLLQLIQKTFS